jgi:hypothetical protein
MNDTKYFTVILFFTVTVTHTHTQIKDTTSDLSGKQKAQQLALMLKKEQTEQAHNKTAQLLEELQIVKQKQRITEQQLKTIKEASYDKVAQETDPAFQVKAHLQPTFWYGSNLELLNDANNSDQYSFLHYVLDAEFKAGNSQWNEKFQPLELAAMLRLKGVMGNVGRYTQTTETQLKIGKALNETDHSHSLQRLLLWGRQLWLKYHFDEYDKNRFFQIGLFPFQLGHGLSLGNAHIVGNIIPGQFNEHAIDQFRPGILLSGTGLKQWLEFQLYCGFIKVRSDTFDATASFTNASSLETRGKPERGPFKKNFVLATQAKFRPYYDDAARRTKLTINPYLLLNSDNSATVEFIGDASQQLYTHGIAGSFERGNLSCSLEFAKNFGHQKVKKWDRNQFYDTGVTFQNHLFYVPSSTAGVDFTDNNFATNDVTDPDDFEFSVLGITPGSTALNYDNGENFAILKADGVNYNFFKNSYTRVRQAYKNTFSGWMLYGDLQYQFNKWKGAVAAGCASGDNPPNDSEEKILLTRLTSSGITYKDVDKDYKGFIGVQEMFTGKAVQSHFMFESRKMNRGINATHQLTPPQFSNLVFLGASARYDSAFGHKKIKADCNVLGFFQYRKTIKDYNYHLKTALNISYTAAHKTDAEKELDFHLGTEINANASIDISKDVSIFGSLAVFIPGSYYNDANGKYIPIATQIKLAGTDFTGIEDDVNKYSIQLGKNTALLGSIGISATFDSATFSRTKKRKRRPFAFLSNLFKREQWA